MKCSMVYADGCRQIMLTPENDIEKQAIKAMATEANESMRVVMHQGTFDDDLRRDGYMVARCQGGYFRRFANSESLMVEITQEANDGS